MDEWRVDEADQYGGSAAAGVPGDVEVRLGRELSVEEVPQSRGFGSIRGGVEVGSSVIET